MTGKGSGKRGRPVGFRLSDNSKRSISTSKTGQQHKQETKDKISKSLIMYFRNKNPISDDINNRYRRVMNSDIKKWLRDYMYELDATVDVMTEKALQNKCKTEITCGNNIEYFSHNITPELLILFKEHCEINGIDPEDTFLNDFVLEDE